MELGLFQLTLQEQNQKYGTNYKLIQGNPDLKELNQRLKSQSRISLDIKTTGSNYLTDRIVGISLSFEPKTGFYIPVLHKTGEMQLPIGLVIDHFRWMFDNPEVTLHLQEAKLYLQFIRNVGIHRIKCRIFDTSIAAILLTYEQSALKLLTEQLDQGNDKGRADSKFKLDEVDIELAGFYAAMDADHTLQLGKRFEEEIIRRRISALLDVEMEVLKLLVEIERNGVKIDIDYLRSIAPEFEERLSALQKQIWEIAGEFNVNSNQQLSEILFNKFKMPVIRKTKEGNSVDAGVLLELQQRTNHPVFKPLLEYRSVEKLYGTYVKGLQNQLDDRSRIHTCFKQCVSTGRLSSSAPNLQNIPESVRKAIVADDGFVIVSFDYSQIELRVLAYLSGDHELFKSFEQELDVHRYTASQIYNVEYFKVTDEMRKAAKTLNFGLVYGISSYSVASELKISEKEAREFMDRYFSKYAGVKRWIAESQKYARTHGYIETMLKRRVPIPGIKSDNWKMKGHSERIAINAPVQGSAADVIKIAMARINMCDKLKYTREILQVHDEILFEIHRSDLQIIVPQIKHIMEMPPTPVFTIPLVVDIESGRSYGELKPLSL